MFVFIVKDASASTWSVSTVLMNCLNKGIFFVFVYSSCVFIIFMFASLKGRLIPGWTFNNLKKNCRAIYTFNSSGQQLLNVFPPSLANTVFYWSPKRTLIYFRCFIQGKKELKKNLKTENLKVLLRGVSKCDGDTNMSAVRRLVSLLQGVYPLHKTNMGLCWHDDAILSTVTLIIWWWQSGRAGGGH